MRIVLLGMHKSGTTLISQCLHKSGVNMVSNLMNMSYDLGNKFERTSCLLINLSLLDECFSKVSYDIYKVIEKPIIKKHILDWHAADVVARLNNEFDNWGFKDPRNCLTYDYWSEILEDHKVIGIYRSPFTVVNHYTKSLRFKGLRIVIMYKVLRAWYIYNYEMLRAVEKNNGIILSYEKFMEDKSSVNSLSKELGIELKEVRFKNLRRSKRESSILLNLIVLYMNYADKYPINRMWARLNDWTL